MSIKITLLPATLTNVAAVDEHGNESSRPLTIRATTLPYQHDQGLINPFTDIIYLGAFNLPDGSGDLEYGRWGYGGYGLAYYPDGDVSGPDDGYPGSLFGRGHVYDWAVSEIGIPEPVISPEKDQDDLPTATTLHPPQCVIGSNALTATLTWIPLAETITSTLHYANIPFNETNLNITQVLSDSIPADLTTCMVSLPYTPGDTTFFFGLRSYLGRNSWSGLSNIVFCPHQDVFLPLLRR